jgi:hypothetical protein
VRRPTSWLCRVSHVARFLVSRFLLRCIARGTWHHRVRRWQRVLFAHAITVKALPGIKSSAIVQSYFGVAGRRPNKSFKRTAPPPLNSSVSAHGAKNMDALEDRLWTLTVVLIVVVVAQATLLVMAIVGWGVNRKKQRFLKLWQRNQLDKLIDLSRRTLTKEPNNLDALLYGGKALRKSGHLKDARLWLERALELEPALRSSIEGQLELIRKKEAAPV